MSLALDPTDPIPSLTDDTLAAARRRQSWRQNGAQPERRKSKVRRLFYRLLIGPTDLSEVVVGYFALGYGVMALWHGARASPFFATVDRIPGPFVILPFVIVILGGCILVAWTGEGVVARRSCAWVSVPTFAVCTFIAWVTTGAGAAQIIFPALTALALRTVLGLNGHGKKSE